MNGSFYAGHGIDWMQKFLDAIPNKQKFSKSIAYALASCIHHQVIYTKNTNITLTHKKLNFFGLDRRSIQTYLFYFQKAGLINYLIKKGNAPKIQLILLSNSTLLTTNNNTKTIKAIYNKGTPVHKSIGGCTLKYRLGVHKSTGSNSRRIKEPSKGGRKKGTKQGRAFK